MIDEVSDVLASDRKHAIKALNGKVSLMPRVSSKPCRSGGNLPSPLWLSGSLHPSENPQYPLAPVPVSLAGR
jgi:hypothetical protein